MYFKSDKEIEYVARGVMDLSLPKVQWTHAAHFAAAIWLIASPAHDPFTDMPGMIRRYNLATGVPNTDTDGYHETITLASLKAAKAFLEAAPDGSALFEVVNNLMASELGTSGWLLEYWSQDVLFSPQARRSWVMPNLKQLPF